MVLDFLQDNKTELIFSVIIVTILLVIHYTLNFAVTKIAKKSGFNDARIRLIRRYIHVSLFFIGFLALAYIFGTDFKDLAVIFSSVFAVIGIGFVAVWSILSNITSGVIMFFNFPHKVGDKIKIHDSDFPMEGIIEDITAFQLHLRLDNGDLVTYPNNLMLQKPVTLIKKDAIASDAEAV
ncbi:MULTISPECIES: mechanosensitive ion channel domain-containing protein [Aestuariibaculum]|uniref:Mechanosensitive ion channel n=1 Tax=Aestuariibaculum marinum TaxID=2683592 RepID=A0A8J6Q041_9FLAO|nr:MULTISPECIES: mechanosensitive ion channel domain-containing protein [Aestuariibaculum]MBD0822438.1 mechanosensitive ion channel [Aestuariibaculum marinum]WMI64858.1 mechanosensitive ion channel [Aestuariibaculum sp. YM273]